MSEPAPYPEYDSLFVVQAVDDLLSHVRHWRDELDKRLERTDYATLGTHALRNYYGEDFYAQVYGDAAFSQVMTAARASLLEGAFTQEFRALRSLEHLAQFDRSHYRWQMPPGIFWDPHVASQPGSPVERRNFSLGLRQLIEALRIERFFPANLGEVVEAL